MQIKYKCTKKHQTSYFQSNKENLIAHNKTIKEDKHSHHFCSKNILLCKHKN